MGANPHANGGAAADLLSMPDFRDYAVAVSRARRECAEATRVLGTFLRDVMKLNLGKQNFRLSAPTKPPPTGWTPS